MLPFEQPEQSEVAGFQLPRFGCLTVREAIALDSALTAHSQMLEELQNPLAIALVSDNLLYPLLACLLLVCRISPEWTLSRVQTELSTEQQQQLSDFLLGERRRWVPIEKLPPAGQPGEAPDWARLFWTLQLHYPSEPRFSAEQFGYCPLCFVEEAIAAVEDLELRRAHRSAVPISLLGCYSLAAQGVKSMEPGHFNPFERMLNRAEAVQEIQGAIARTLISELEAGRVPDWAIPMIPIGKFRLAAK